MVVSQQSLVVDRIFTPGLAQVAYFVADRDTGEVAVIDPRRDVDAYVAWAEERGMTIIAVLETHVHADFVSGAIELADRTGAAIYTSRLGNQAFDHTPIDDGEVIRVGAHRLEAVFTPGHTPEHLAYLLYEGDSETPMALFSGDVLFVGDVGRPDLLGKEATEKLSHQLYETVTNRLLTLADDVVVYPGHTAGSACGKKIGDAPSTTIGNEKTGNYAFQKMERDEFVAKVMEDMPKPPAYYPVLKRVNKDGAAKLETLPQPRAISADELRALQAEGALVIDTREPADFEAGHIPNALFAGWGGNFHMWMGWKAPYEQDLILVTGDNGFVGEIVTALRQIGLDRVVAYLDGGMAAWDGEKVTLDSMPVEELDRQRQEGLTVLDVRAEGEYNEGHIPDAANVFAGDLAQGMKAPDTLGTAERIAVICGSGYRSTVAASLLQAQGFTNLVNVDSGMEAWNEAELPVTPGSDT